jgi:CTD nuclear envelope phosphatase 1
VTIDRQPVRFFVHLRPHVDYFLSVVSEWFDLVIFTASMEIYGTSVAEKLDRGRGLLPRRYFRQHCTMDYSGYTKDLSAIHPDLSSIFILDNSPAAYRNFTSKFERFSFRYYFHNYSHTQRWLKFF